MEQSLSGGLSSQSKISCATIVAIPTPTEWTQAYHAGSLFAVLSLKKEPSTDGEAQDLNIIGKEILNSLEEEFFTLEDKTLQSITQAITTVLDKVPSSYRTNASLAVCFIPKLQITDEKAVLYGFVYGKSRILLKRRDTIGSIAKGTDTLISSSGFLDDSDLIILETTEFSQHIGIDRLKEALQQQTPGEIAEQLAPLVQNSNGGASAVIILFQHQTVTEEEEKESLLDETKEFDNFTLPTTAENEEKYEIVAHSEATYAIETEEKKQLLHTSRPSRRLLPPFISRIRSLPHTKRLFLTIAVILICLLAISSFLVIKKRESQKIQAIFDKTYPVAQQKYDEGQALVSLNKSLAHDDFNQAQQILTANQSQFPKNSDEYKKISALLTKVTYAANQTADTAIVSLQAVDSKQSLLLQYEMQHSQIRYIVEREALLFAGTDTGITQIDTKTGEEKTIIKNDKEWKSLNGLGEYSGNIYVLDKDANAIIKFVATASGYQSLAYLASGVTPDFSQAVSLTNDTSMYVLLNTGAILRYTRGTLDSFTISGIDKPLSHPTRIVTSTDLSKFYILDNGNQRIVVLSKTGAYDSQYEAAQLKNASDIDVQEAAKKIFVLSDSKIYSLDLK